MSIKEDILLEGLLQHNYFPGQKKQREELPPIFTSKAFTPDISKTIISNYDYRSGGYDQVKYETTRYNNVSRTLSIPHPMPYCLLAHSLVNNWGKLDYITKNDHSLVTPKKHNDGRIIIMNYERAKKKVERRIEKCYTKKFYVEADIANFYPSIYSHAIPWALVGRNRAKDAQNEDKWFNRIDDFQRLTKRDETNGVPIGPATSNIVSEAILARIDEELSVSEDFDYYRFIDDYKAYCSTYKKAETFVRRLSEELARFKLKLNIKKTSIKELPLPADPEWLLDIYNHLPPPDKRKPVTITRFMDYALQKQEQTPDGSVLKYAAKSIMDQLSPDSVDLLLKYLLDLCIDYPILLPTLGGLFERLFEENETVASVYFDQLQEILLENATHKRSDAMTWTLYYLNKYSQHIPSNLAENVVESADCVPILTLYLSGEYDSKVVHFANNLDSTDLYQLDQYWLLLYQLFYDGKINHPYADKNAYDRKHLKSNKDSSKDARNREIQVFQALKAKDVTFIESNS